MGGRPRSGAAGGRAPAAHEAGVWRIVAAARVVVVSCRRSLAAPRSHCGSAGICARGPALRAPVFAVLKKFPPWGKLFCCGRRTAARAELYSGKAQQPTCTVGYGGRALPPLRCRAAAAARAPPPPRRRRRAAAAAAPRWPPRRRLSIITITLIFKIKKRVASQYTSSNCHEPIYLLPEPTFPRWSCDASQFTSYDRTEFQFTSFGSVGTCPQFHHGITRW
jgi:hypothetical protein